MRRVFTTIDPWREVEQLRSDFQRLLPRRVRWPQRHRREQPAVNVWQGDKEVVFTMELPGIDPEALDATVKGNAVTIRAERTAPVLNEGESWLRRERPEVPVERTVELPVDVDPETAEATYTNGVLTLRLQRPEKDQPKTVAIKTA